VIGLVDVVRWTRELIWSPRLSACAVDNQRLAIFENPPMLGASIPFRTPHSRFSMGASIPFTTPHSRFSMGASIPFRTPDSRFLNPKP